MDSYPEDLLVGVFPLVFAVDAIHPGGPVDEGAASARRTSFDKFLDAVAASLVEDEDSGGGGDKKRTVSLFRADSEDSDDDGLEDFGYPKKQPVSLSANLYPSFAKGPVLRNTSTDSMDSLNVASYANALKHGQGFFQRARIESISAKCGFPPSKDPEGTENISFRLNDTVKGKHKGQLSDIFNEHPLDGILPAGWLEKHVHALPSVILVVCGVTSSRPQQEQQDRHLLETIEHLCYGLAAKRRCSIQVIGLLGDDVSPLQGDVWSRTISNTLHELQGSPPPHDSLMHVALLRVSADLQASDTGMPTSPALKQLHSTIRDASLAYYLGQARRTKAKLGKLRELKYRKRASTPPLQLLPLLIRYCFKIAMFYEFQWKHEKSLRYMCEGYSYISKYYQYLVTEQMDTADHIPVGNDRGEHHLRTDSVTGGEESVEVALPSPSTAAIEWHTIVPPPPDDMVHQCRAVADWMNLKILSAGLVSRTESGLHAAVHQWRMHSRVFCSRRYSTCNKIPPWFEWAYTARQRLVMSQLIERYPPTSLGDLGPEHDEALVSCSPWRLYESAAEATLVLSQEVSTATASKEELMDESERTDPMRLRYVGGVGNEGFGPALADEKRVEHREKALQYIERAISLFEQELEREKKGFYAEDEFSETSSSRTGARLFYVAGGILLGMGRHPEAVGKLTKAAKYSKGWHQLELAVRRMLIECYEKHIPSYSDANENSDTLASMILDSYFNAEMSSAELRRALNHFLSVTGGESLKWFHDAVDEEDASLPFSFAVSFPGRTHATSGDTVEASVLIRSNLDYAVHVNDVMLLSLAGDLNIPLNDLLSAANASEGSEDGIIIQAKTAIVITTEVKLPKDISMIASDDSGNGGEQQAIAGKGAFAKSAKPRSAGVTAAGGARLVSQEKIGPGNQSSQGWNLNFLGGKPVRCDGLRLLFHPVQAERTSAEKVTLIELTIKRKKARTAANIKRTPFEEENYIASAWSRPHYLPLSRGPRSLRVSAPMPQITVSNLTDDFTGGKAIEGTVNRMILKLETGSNSCANMKMSISCFSVLVTPSGSTKRLVAPDEITPEAENGLDMHDPSFRTPVLVCPGEVSETSCGYKLPGGWRVAGSGQRHENITLPSLQKGECSYVPLDIFRPGTSLSSDSNPLDPNAQENIADVSLCKTDFYVTLTYKQERPEAKKSIPLRRRARRPVRRPPTLTTEAAGTQKEDNVDIQKDVGVRDVDNHDDVSLEFSGSMIWTKPLAASFVPGARDKFPSGSRHPGNSAADDNIGSDAEFALVDGEAVTSKCTLELDTAMEGLQIEVLSVGFKASCNNDEESPTALVLKSGNNDNLILQTKRDDPSRKLCVGSKLSIAYTVEAKMTSNFRRGGVSSRLGVVEVDWLPAPFTLPTEVLSHPSSSSIGKVRTHGPLALETPSKSQFHGPPFYVENAPFDAVIVELPSSPSVGTSFHVAYCVQNKTNLHQRVTIDMNAPPVSSLGDGLLLCGTISGELSFGPYESRTLSYNFLANRPGPLNLPALNIVSRRYGSWVVHDKERKREVYVFP